MPPRRITPTLISAPVAAPSQAAHPKNKKNKKKNADYFEKKEAKLQARIDNGGGMNNRLDSMIAKYEGIHAAAAKPKSRGIKKPKLHKPDKAAMRAKYLHVQEAAPNADKCAAEGKKPVNFTTKAGKTVQFCRKPRRSHKYRTKEYYLDKLELAGIPVEGLRDKKHSIKQIRNVWRARVGKQAK